MCISFHLQGEMRPHLGLTQLRHVGISPTVPRNVYRRVYHDTMSDEVTTTAAPVTTLTVKDPMALAAVRAEYWASGNLKQSCARAGVPYDTGKYWNKKGWLDQDNDEITMALARTITPETVIAMAQNAAGLVIESQKQVAKTIGKANARDASTIARQQFDIHQLATGQATQRVEFMSADDLIREVEKLRLDEGFIEGEVVEEQ